MELPNDPLKVKAVKCINNAGTNRLTIGKTYKVYGVRSDGAVRIFDDAGYAECYKMSHFEPGIESEESLAQDMELTSEFETEASEPKFQVGNKVYKYGETDVKTVLEVFEGGYMRISNYPHRVNHEVLCHATPENHAVLSKPFPAIEFEQAPKELAGTDLAKALIEKGWVGFNCLCGHSGDENAITDTIVTGINNDGQFTTIDGQLFRYAIPMKGWRPLKAQEVGL